MQGIGRVTVLSAVFSWGLQSASTTFGWITIVPCVGRTLALGYAMCYCATIAVAIALNG